LGLKVVRPSDTSLNIGSVGKTMT